MNNKYSQGELNQILLSKSLNDFYFAIIENRQELLTDEVYDEITKRNKIICGDNKADVEDLFEKTQKDERLKDFSSDLMRLIYSLAQVRHMAILTVIDDDVYDIGNAEFVDLRRNKIIHYDRLINYYNKTNARIRIFTPEEEPQLTQKTALVDVDDESIAQSYEDAHIHQEESEDLTNSFFDEINGKPYIYTLRRK